MPSRAEIQSAYQSALQGRAPAAAAPMAAAAPIAAALAAAPPAARTIDADELAALLKRARSLIEIGDIAAARLLLERAAGAREASAALLLAQTYDPAVLGTPDMRSITPDPAMARDWYHKAAQFGSPEAQQRLAQIQN
jgi:TPR repeat protein